jgi:hypothetical protein
MMANQSHTFKTTYLFLLREFAWRSHQAVNRLTMTFLANSYFREAQEVRHG